MILKERPIDSEARGACHYAIYTKTKLKTKYLIEKY